MRAVIFDLGRVLVHYNHQTTLEAVAAISKVTAPELHALFSAIEQDLGVGNLSAADLHQFLIERAGVSDDETLFLQAYGAGITRDEAALAYALELQARPDLTIGVISNTNAAHVWRLDEDVPELNELDLVMYSNEVGLLKPDPAIFELALEQHITIAKSPARRRRVMVVHQPRVCDDRAHGDSRHGCSLLYRSALLFHSDALSHQSLLHLGVLQLHELHGKNRLHLLALTELRNGPHKAERC